MLSEIADISGNKELAEKYNTLGYNLLQIKLEENKENIPLAFEKASVLQKNKDLKGATEIYDDVLIALPSNYRALKEKARIMLVTQQWQNAINLYEKLLRLYNPEEEFYNNTAIAFIKTGNYEDALTSFSNTLKLDPSNIDALYNRSKLYKMLGDNQNAQKDLDTMKEILRTKQELTENEKELLKL